MIAKMLPCPFCGESLLVELIYSDPYYSVLCRGCENSTSYQEREKAIAAWNRRPEMVRRGLELLRELIEAGPYCDGDGECSFCPFAPNDSEDLDHLIAHSEKCLYRRANEYLGAKLVAKI